VQDIPNSVIYGTAGAYAPQQSLAALQYGPGYNSTYIYNNRLQPCWIYITSATALAPSTPCTSTASAATGLDLKYNYNLGVGDNGNVIGITNNRDTTRSQQFTYDQVNRIVQGESTSIYSSSPAHCWGEAYVYDNQSTGSGEFGNLTNINVASTAYNGCTQESLSIAATSSNQVSGFNYDQVGNTITDGHNTYAYDAESEIKSASGVNYTYDGDGNRIEKNTIKLYWYGAGSTILNESDTSGNITDEFIFFGAKRLAHRMPESNSLTYYAQDMLGTNVVILPSTLGNPCYDADYYPFGGEREYTSTCAENYKFEGKKRDQETGNDDFGARYYASWVGRWESPDWSSTPEAVPYANLTNPQTLNLYDMVSDNPETFADLDGHLGGLGEPVVEPQTAGGDCQNSQGSCKKSSSQPQQNAGTAQSQTPQPQQTSNSSAGLLALPLLARAGAGALEGGEAGGAAGTVEPGGGNLVGAIAGTVLGATVAALAPNIYTKTKDALSDVGTHLSTAIDHLGKLNGPDQNPNPRQGWKDTVRKSADNIDKQANKISNKSLANAAHYTADLLRGLVN
jgi:RHS repeat-associated protein